MQGGRARCTRCHLLGALLVVPLLLLAACQGEAQGNRRTLEVGKSERIKIGASFEISVSNPDILRAVQEGDTLVVTGLKAGKATVSVKTTGFTQEYDFDVKEESKGRGNSRKGKEQGTAAASLAERICQAIGIPSVKVREQEDVIVLEGSVTSEQELEKAERIARNYTTKEVDNQLKVKAKVGQADEADEAEKEMVEPTEYDASQTPVIQTRPGQHQNIKIELPKGFSFVIEAAEGTIEEVAIGDYQIIEIVPPSKRELVITGRQPGKTNLIVREKLEEDGQLKFTNFLIEVTTPKEKELDLRPVGPVPLSLTEVKQSIEAAFQALKLNGVQVVVLKAPRGEGFVVVLGGEVETPKQEQAAMNVARIFASDVVSGLEVRTAALPPANDKKPELSAEEKKRQHLQRLMPPGVEVEVQGDTVILRGRVKNLKERKRLEELAKQFSQVISFLELEEPPKVQHVLAEVKVLEVGRSDLRRLGIDIGSPQIFGGAAGVGGVGGAAGVGLAQLPPQTGQFVFGEVVSPPAIPGQVAPGIVGAQPVVGAPFTRATAILAQINMLVQQGKARILQQPSQRLLEGTPGTFLVGGSIPLPTGAILAGGGGAAAVTGVTFLPFGVTMTVRPIEATEAGEIGIQLRVELSTPDFTKGAVIGGTTIPGFTLRSLGDQKFILRDGGTIVLAGLIQDEDRQNIKKIPFLSSIPVLGELFKSREFSRSQTELVIILTVRLEEEEVSEEALEMMEQLKVAPDLPQPRLPTTITPTLPGGGFGR